MSLFMSSWAVLRLIEHCSRTENLPMPFCVCHSGAKKEGYASGLHTPRSDRPGCDPHLRLRGDQEDAPRETAGVGGGWRPSHLRHSPDLAFTGQTVAPCLVSLVGLGGPG